MKESYLKTIVALLVLFGAFAAQAGNYGFVEPSGPLAGPYLWSDTTFWRECGDYKNDITTYRGNIKPMDVPGDGKMLMVDSNYLNPETPLKIDEGRFVLVNQMRLGNIVGQPYGDELHTVALEVGKGATLTTDNQTSAFNVGDAAGASGLMLVDAGATVSNVAFRIGNSGFGVVSNLGGRIDCRISNANYGSFIGYEATATGHLVQVSGTGLYGRCRIGRKGTGTLEFLGGGADFTPTIGADAGGHGTMIVHAGAAVTNSITVGSGENSYGSLQLCGGTNLCSGSVSIRNTASAYGEMRGWGAFYRPSSSDVCGELNGGLYMNGCVIADAAGVEGRVLDLHLARSGNGGANNARTSIANGMDGTNGWYAVDKGVLVYPMLRANAARYQGTFGDNANPECDFVNTVRLDYNQMANKGPWLEARLYANDSAEIPAGLEGKVLGVWGFRSCSSYNNYATQLTNFTDFGLRIRYDHRNLKAGDTVALMRYDVTAEKWVRLARVAHDASSPYIAAVGMAADGANYDRNLGIFAVVKEPKGLLLIIK